jgi:protein subunit release factor A
MSEEDQWGISADEANCEEEIDPETLRIEVYYPGSGVRVTHLPTRSVAEARKEDASQVENRDAALAELREVLCRRRRRPASS